VSHRSSLRSGEGIPLKRLSAIAGAVLLSLPLVVGARGGGTHSSASGTHSSGTHSSGGHSSSSHSTGTHSSTSAHGHTAGSGATAPSTSHSTKAVGVKRDSHGRIARSEKAKHDFQKSHPCPSTGRSSGACPGYVVDHVVPLKRGGADNASNMQWQTVQAAKIKDKTE